MSIRNPFDILKLNIKENPDRVVFGDYERVLSGKESIELINKISALISNKLHPEDQNVGIAIFLPRNTLYLSSIFSIWQIGHYFIPLNNQWPAQHLHNILRKSQPHLVISMGPIKGVENTVSLEEIEKIPNPSVNEKEQWALKRETAHLAYVIFTSGSSGEQKGVMISIEAYHSYITWTRKYFTNFINNRSLLITAELTFDITMGDIAFALTNGTEIHVSPDPKSIPWHAKLIISRKIDTFYSVPSTISSLFTWAKKRNDINFNHLRLIISGGDSFALDLIYLVKDVAPKAEFHNVYGPTELTINCFATRVDKLKKRILKKGLVPIGLPFPHLNTMLLPENNETNEDSDTMGELLVSGPQQMEGYFNDKALTKKYFIKFKGNNYYCTGDLVEKDTEGYHYVLGRIDNLVKIKGYRINPTEIDNVLKNNPLVIEAKTVTFKEEESPKQIVSFIITNHSKNNYIKILLEFCRDSLPHYMVPNEIINIETIPTGSSGKYDDKKLKNMFLKEFNANNTQKRSIK